MSSIESIGSPHGIDNAEHARTEEHCAAHSTHRHVLAAERDEARGEPDASHQRSPGWFSGVDVAEPGKDAKHTRDERDAVCVSPIAIHGGVRSHGQR